MKILRNTALSATIGISSLCTIVFFFIFFELSFHDPVSGYCNFYNCTCVRYGSEVCEQYNADVYYRIIDRKYPSYDTWVRNAILSFCPKEGICYLGKQIGDKDIYFVEQFSEGSFIFIVLFFVFLGIYCMSCLIKWFVVDRIEIKDDEVPTQADKYVELEEHV